MNETKKRGRPSKAEIAAREAQAIVPETTVPETTHNGDESHEPEDVIEEQQMAQTPVLLQATDEAKEARDKAQAYALKVWAGQSDSLGRGERVTRIRRAVEGQGLSMDGVLLPGDKADDTEWTEEDERPITWRKPGAAA